MRKAAGEQVFPHVFGTDMYGRDILVRVIIRKDGRKAAYASQRNSQTDFPLIACCVSRLGHYWDVSVGARPARAQVIRILDDGHDSLGQLAKEAAEHFTFGTNLRGSAGYRKALAQVREKEYAWFARGSEVLSYGIAVGGGRVAVRMAEGD